MKTIIVFILLMVAVQALPSKERVKKLSTRLEESEMDQVLKDYSAEGSVFCNELAKANWNVQTDVQNPAYPVIQAEKALAYAAFQTQYYDDYFKDAEETTYESEDIKRQLKLLKNLGTSALPDEDLAKLTTVRTKMSSVYNNAKICPYNEQDCDLDTNYLTLDPEIEEVMASSRDYDELLYIWTAWHDSTGPFMREDYKEYVALLNQAATLNGFSDAGEMWRARYENDDFVNIAEQLWNQVEPLYDELHTYMKYKLRKKYKGQMDETSDTIPAHILGNMWAQTWGNMYEEFKPFPDALVVDVTSRMRELNYTVLRMFEDSNEFYLSLGLEDNEMSYTGESVIIKPEDRVIACHASAWDFCDGQDFRIKMCTNINMEDYETVHHEMGHIQYYLLYKDLALPFRGGSNPGFHEAVGDAISLSVGTNKHLLAMDLLVIEDEEYVESYEDNINALFGMALERVAFLPFGYLVDKWRWDVFSGAVTESDWNDHWWKLRELYQKVSAPTTRGEQYFDPGAKYHIPADSQYMSYFTARILQFQFYKAMCIEAGLYNPANPDPPLHQCDFFHSTAAGEKLKAGLSLGMSKPWPDALEAITGQRAMDASALLEYFNPLLEYLKVENARLTSESEMEEILKEYSEEGSKFCNELVKANWNVQTDVQNPDYPAIQAEKALAYAAFQTQYYDDYFKDAEETTYESEDIKRQLKLLKNLGTSALPDEDLAKLTTVRTKMSSVYNNAKICPYNEQDCDLDTNYLTLDPEIEEVMASSRDYDELLYIWTAWHDSTGPFMREDYKEYVALLNQAATLNGFSDAGEMWRARYENDDFVNIAEQLWNQVEPLYDELHTYMKYKLRKKYKGQMDETSDTIPAHILGNMWAQTWGNMYEEFKPFPDALVVDVTSRMRELNYTVLRMFEDSNEFYLSLGLEDNEMSYTGESVIIKPEDRVIACHASAWDFCDGQDFRIKMCTNINMEDYETVHHEMGHIQYYLLYKDLALPFRGGSNPGFHEAVGDAISLSVGTNKHLLAMDLLVIEDEEYVESYEDNINALFGMALERVAFLPFGYLVDKWRWDVFSGAVTESDWNDHWWKLRELYQKVSAPTTRGEQYFDPGAKYHIPADSQYMSYFTARILQFQFYKAMCIEAGLYNPANPDPPLHQCDFFHSTAAGEKLKAGLSLGMSKPWPDALEAITGQRAMDASALLEYFNPLLEYLKVENARLTSESEMEEILKEYSEEGSKFCNELVKANWNVQTDVQNPDYPAIQAEKALAYAAFQTQYYDDYFKDAEETTYESEDIKRQLKLLKNLGTSALPDEDLAKLTTVRTKMSSVYNNAKICPYNEQDCDLDTNYLTLDPEIEEVMASSRDYDELLYIWTAWHDSTGPFMREDYKEYVTLLNQAATLNGFSDAGEMWRARYENDDFVNIAEQLWNQVEPLYDELHTYMKYKLRKKYKGQMDETSDTIPAHILGNMWAQTWGNMYEEFKPFPDALVVDVTSRMRELNYTVLRMFEDSNEFYLSLGLEDNEMSYTGESVIIKPEDRVIACHASAWDFCDGQDFRIKMCTNINMEDYETVHHEMGHIQYYLLYKDLALPFRGGSNPGFHEAVGDAISLSVGTNKHLLAMDLLVIEDEEYVESYEDNINALFGMALERVAFLPFGYLVDKWRWDVFSGAVTESDWNDHWWKLRELYQKVSAPTTRGEQYFDPGAKYHIPADSQYMSYFTARILQFQFYKAMCIEAGLYNPANPDPPLHQCDFFHSTAAGEKLKVGLSLGMSKPWPDALEAITGQRAMDASALLEYFNPLLEYLKVENARLTSESEMEEILKEYSEEGSKFCNELVKANWNVQTDVQNPDYPAIQAEKALAYAAFQTQYYDDYFKDAEETTYESEDIKRQLKLLKNLGTSALPDEDLAKLTTVRTKMSSVYNNAKICPYNEQDCDLDTNYLTLDPEIEEVMASSRDYDELLYIWTAWHDSTGPFMREDYKEYVALLNQAATLNGFSDAGEMWRARYENDDFVNIAEQLWNQVEPLYDELHTYMKYKLRKKYKGQMDETSDTIPAHILGNMWAQTWGNMYEEFKPFPDALVVDVTSRMRELNYTVLRMFEDSNEFYLSLGLEDNEMSYTGESVIIKPEDRVIACHASAWDFCDGQDFRIKMCTNINMEDYETVHHEMGHIQYYLLYKDLALPFRGGSNPGFHEAVGDAISLSVGTNKHLLAMDLLVIEDEEYVESYEDNINALFGMALERVAFLPFGYLVDKWRWDVFSGAVTESDWNDHWWKLRELYQKVSAPTTRGEQYFDPGAKYHIPADSQYMSYFTARILQFQFYKAMCIEAGLYNPANPDPPLHQCDFFHSTAAGEKLKAGLSLGMSKPWPDALEAITGQRAMDASALLEYFNPLLEYLKVENARLTSESEMEEILKEYSEEGSKFCNELVKANWNVQTDVQNPDYPAIQAEKALAYAAFQTQYYDDYFKDAEETTYESEDIKRQLKLLKNLGTSALPDEDLAKLTTVRTKMSSVYNNAKICPYNEQDCDLDTNYLTLDPEIEEVMASSRDYDELLYIWTAWHDSTGPFMREDYKEYVALLNQAATLNGFSDAGEMWRARYENDDFVNIAEQLWNQVEPLYDELHTYMKYKLRKKYKGQMDETSDTIPAHILGNMWAQTWGNMYEEFKPFPDALVVDVTSRMRELNYTVLRMFEDSNEFYLSLGLEDNEMSYTGESVIIKPEDRVIACHASAWDFCDGQDFRIKMCTNINMEDYETVHHEMGHIQYYLLYKDLALPFRGGSNPGFHEAVGDAISLSVGTNKHLLAMDLLVIEDEEYVESYEDNINALFGMALERVAFLPFGYLVDKWRWDVFSGAVTESDWNDHWWKLRELYQKVSAPTTRGEQYFDPGAKYHIPADSQYMSYFTARILQFQFYKAMCIEAGLYNPANPDPPLHQCDFFHSTAAGEKLKAGLSLGMSKPWPDALEAITGQRAMDASALLEYFNPLLEYLKVENARLTSESEMEEILKEYSEEGSKFCNELVKANWNVQTDVQNPDYPAIQAEKALAYAAFQTQYYDDYFKDAEETTYESEDIKRQLKLLKNLGTSALPDEDLAKLTTVRTKMSSVYNNAKICPYNEQDCDLDTNYLTLDPEIEEVMASSRDYDELLYIWTAWHDSTGPFMREDYKEYVTLLNQAATLNGFSDAGEMWRARYENDDFVNIAEQLWNQVEPLYDELHTYMKYKLRKKYKGQMDETSDTIPAHILGNMWAQTWGNMYEEFKPFPDALVVDVTSRMRELNYTVLRMFEDSNEFYLSLGLEDNEMSYTGESVIIKPEDRVIACHASAWDFCDGQDFRIKMCTNINMEDYETVHHEMGHIQYYLLYKDLALPFRGGSNPGFHEAVGDAISLSVGTNKHLLAMDLLVIEDEEYVESYEDNINALFGMALERVAFLPFGYLVDKWRWDVFSGAVTESDWNDHWWKLRELYQKVSAPTTRGEQYFDPGAKYHIPADSQYMSYFTARILQFQFYKAMCIEAGLYNPANPDPPLHQCDFFHSTAAGEKLKVGLSLGMSKPWPDALEAITGQRAMDASALLEYFNPLLEYLKVENARLTSESEMEEILKEYSEEGSKFCNELVKANWNVQTDVQNPDYPAIQAEKALAYAAFQTQYYDDYFKDAEETTYESEDIKRQLKLLKNLGTSALPDEDLAKLTTVRTKMSSVYNNAKICPYNEQDCDLDTNYLTLDPEIEEVMASSRDYDELLYIWTAWHDSTGPFMREDYKEYVALLNQAATLNGFSDAGEMWRARYENDDFVNIAEQLWNQVEPLYDELHTYMKYKLRKKYKGQMDETSDTIPAHILGNMWAQTWGNMYEEFKPFPDALVVDVTSRMRELNYTVLRMFEDSNEFYLSLGLEDNEMSYTGESVIIKPEDRVIACHASAWDFCDGQDFRIKMCTNINMEDYETVHHEMGHIQYYLLYKDLALPFRGGSNPGFHEAVGDAISLSVGTNKHLLAMDLLVIEDEEYVESYEDNINALFGMALERVAFLPFGYLVDKWRWDVFSGAVTESDWNDHWWKLRELYQKVSAPTTRGEQYFDPGAKYHIPADSQYMSYFTARILQFQFYKAMCIEAGLYNPANPDPPLHQCDFFHSTAAGEKLKAGLSLGMSKPWPDALEAITGQRAMDASALLEYFNPLLEYLKVENARLTSESEMEEILKEYSEEGSKFCNELVKANWNVQTDVQNPDYPAIQAEKALAYAAFQTQYYDDYFKDAEETTYESEDIKRQLKLLKNLGTSALPDEDLAKLTTVRTKMSSVYNNAKICPYNEQDCDLDTNYLTLDPEIEEVMASSRDYDELLYIWTAWHDSTGPFMREDYKEYVALLNQAATLNGFSDAGEMWRARYENDDFVNIAEQLWNQVEPLYDELHTYMKYKLRKKYKGQMDETSDTIPAHILGNMWAQTWGNMYEEFKPFPDALVVDVTSRMRELNYTVLRMFEDSNEFYLSLGLEDNEMSYTGESVIIKPEDRVIACHASAWDFCDGQDFRIKMCTNINMEDYETVHHEMGHIQYYLLYKDLALPFRGGSNPGFHEAVGDAISLSVGTNKHLLAMDLLVIEDEEYVESYEDNINALFGMALERVAFLPFGYLVDKWRWDVFSGAVTESDWNDHWWKLRELYQKVSAPTTRGEQYFDPGAKYHIPADSQYMSYFTARILQFQFYKAMCIEAGLYNPANPDPPLHQCDFFHSTTAGEKLKAGLSLGMSKPWPDALEAITGQRVMDASALLEYFDPLYKYLVEQNEINERVSAMRQALESYDQEAQTECNKLVLAEWAVASDVNNEEKTQAYAEAVLEYSVFVKQKYNELFDGISLNDYPDEDVQRQLMYLTKLGTSALEDSDLTTLTLTVTKMETIYNDAKICPYNNRNCIFTEDDILTLDPEITEVMASSTNYDELQYIWEEWHEKTGKLMREDYETYIELSNKAAVLNGFDDYGDMWRFDYEDDNFIENIERLWTEVEPLYNALHTYVRHKLIEIYGTNKLSLDGEFIPAHLLGNMWAQSWVNLYDRVKPFPDASLVDVTASMIEANYDALKMFQESDRFYQALGLEGNEMSYTGESIIEKPDDRVIACHASAWDFCDGADFRIKMCTSVNMEDFVTVHHEMGHIQYFILYKDLPVVFRTSANPGFHEAVGDLIALSVATPKHLEKIGLLRNYEDSQEDNINALFQMALERVAFLPFGLMIDMWRWKVFNNEITKDHWNEEWWNLREKYQKVTPPGGKRGEEYFDPGAKYHIPANVQYIAYFVAHILEFQLHKALCITAGQYDPANMETNPLHKCDIDESLEAGDKLRAGLSLGLSKHWSESLREITGETEISAQAILEYFEPLLEFLKTENENWKYEEPNPSGNDNNDDIPIIVGGVIGGALVLGLAGYGVHSYMKKKRITATKF